MGNRAGVCFVIDAVDRVTVSVQVIVQVNAR